jgi:hypothetical protein
VFFFAMPPKIRLFFDLVIAAVVLTMLLVPTIMTEVRQAQQRRGGAMASKRSVSACATS